MLIKVKQNYFFMLKLYVQDDRSTDEKVPLLTVLYRFDLTLIYSPGFKLDACIPDGKSAGLTFVLFPRLSIENKLPIPSL